MHQVKWNQSSLNWLWEPSFRRPGKAPYKQHFLYFTINLTTFYETNKFLLPVTALLNSRMTNLIMKLYPYTARPIYHILLIKSQHLGLHIHLLSSEHVVPYNPITEHLKTNPSLPKKQYKLSIPLLTLVLQQNFYSKYLKISWFFCQSILHLHIILLHHQPLAISSS